MNKKAISIIKRLVGGFLIFAAVLLIGILLVDWRVESLGRSRVVSLEQLAEMPAFDCVIVPGALVYPNGTPSAMLQDRLDMAITIYEGGCTNRILVSGDHGQEDYNEVGIMRQYLLDHDIPETDIFMDHAGFDTYDTLYRAQAIFQVKRAIITTQDFHLYRALYIGRQIGLDVQGVACQYDPAYQKDWYRFREYLARCKALLDAEILHVKPTYEGPAIPITGDGRTTLD